MSDEQDWGRLARYVQRRRTQLGLTQAELHQVGGPAPATVRMIEGAQQKNYRRIIMAKLERALGWEEDSVERILAGGEPVVVGTADEVADAPSAAGRPEWLDLPMHPEDMADPSLMSPEQVMRHLETWRIAGAALFWQGLELLVDKRRATAAARHTGTG